LGDRLPEVKRLINYKRFDAATGKQATRGLHQGMADTHWGANGATRNKVDPLNQGVRAFLISRTHSGDPRQAR
jgi:hypothetical protein